MILFNIIIWKLSSIKQTRFHSLTGLQNQTDKGSWIHLQNICEAFSLVQHDSHCSKDHSGLTVSVNTQFCQGMAKGQMVSLNNAERAMRMALPPVMYNTGENVTQIICRALMSRSITEY